MNYTQFTELSVLVSRTGNNDFQAINCKVKKNQMVIISSFDSNFRYRSCSSEFPVTSVRGRRRCKCHHCIPITNQLNFHYQKLKYF